MYQRKVFSTVAALAAIFAVSTPAFATAWSFNANGSNPAFGWSSGNHLNAYSDPLAFGSPVVDNNGFFFQNAYGDMDFRAEVGIDPVDHASVEFAVNTAASTPGGAPGLNFIIFREEGTWGGNQADVSVQYDFNVFDPVEFDWVFVSVPVTFFPNGTWKAEFTLTPAYAAANSDLGLFPNTPFDDFEVQITNIIQANGSNPNTFIQKTRSTVIFPEPGTLGLLAIMVPLALLRKRR